MLAVNVTGFKKSGKTTFAAALVRELAARGRRVGAVKFSHHPFDLPEADTGKLAEHAVAVAGLGEGEAFVRWPGRAAGPKGIYDLLPLFAADVVVIEGGKSLSALPRILVLRDPAEAVQLSPELALGTFGPVAAPTELGLPVIPSVEAAADLVLSKGFLVAGLDCEACGRPDCRTLAADIVGGRARTDACVAQATSLKVTVNGVPLALNPFIERLVKASVKGVVAELKGYMPGKIVIEMDA